MKEVFAIICCWFVCLQISGQNNPVSYTKDDSLRVVELLEKGSKAPANEVLTLFYAKQLMNLPYVAHTLEIKDKSEHLAINLQSLDCTTLVENCCALALTTRQNRWLQESQSLLQSMDSIRHEARFGQGSRASCQHFCSDETQPDLYERTSRFLSFAEG